MSTPIDLVFLARGIDAGLPALQRFLASHKACPPGIPHRLRVIAKGWDAEGRAQVEALARGAGAEVVDQPDDGFDLGAYARYAAATDAPVCAFLNSHSEVLRPGWLEMMAHAAKQPGIGAVGCSGSWATTFLSPRVSLAVIGDLLARRRLRPTFIHARFFCRVALPSWLREGRVYPMFPNRHLRTNAFLIATDLFRRFAPADTIPATKRDSHLMECGRGGMTQWLARHDLATRVVTADGAFAPADWWRSGGYATPGQTALLVGDNMTRDYAAYTTDQRRAHEVAVWGRYLTPEEGDVA